MTARKTILITGCSAGGIGEALALAFHQRKHRVIATVRDPLKATALTDAGIDVLEMDVCQQASIESVVKGITETRDGRLDILVNNAGIGYSMPILDVDLDASRSVFETNFFGRVAVTQAFAPLLIKSKGTIVNIGSINGFCPTPFSAMYSACCAAVHHWSNTLRLEMKPFDVKVVLIITGAIETKFLSNLPVKTLPPTSLYLPEAKTIEGGMNGSGVGAEFLDRHKYAERVVRNVLSSRPEQHHWLGVLATRIWMASTFLWTTAWDMLLEERFGLLALKKKVVSGEKAAAKDD